MQKRKRSQKEREDKLTKKIAKLRAKRGKKALQQQEAKHDVVNIEPPPIIEREDVSVADTRCIRYQSPSTGATPSTTQQRGLSLLWKSCTISQSDVEYQLYR